LLALADKVAGERGIPNTELETQEND
jgi:hypothetical protein